MSENKPMSLLLLEDDDYCINDFKKHVEIRTDIVIVAATKSSTDALDLVKLHKPDGIILDIELTNGSGSGTTFLIQLRKAHLDYDPIIIANTNIEDRKLYYTLHSYGVSMIYNKHQANYSYDDILDQFIYLKEAMYKSGNKSARTVTPAQHSNYVLNRISTELNNLGIPSHLVGRKYIENAILYLIENEKKPLEESVFNHIARIYFKKVTSITTAMQTAIAYAWEHTSYEDLEFHYRYKIQGDKVFPGNTDLIYNLKNKILLDM